jgi:hypothetical protein
MASIMSRPAKQWRFAEAAKEVWTLLERLIGEADEVMADMDPLGRKARAMPASRSALSMVMCDA